MLWPVQQGGVHFKGEVDAPEEKHSLHREESLSSKVQHMSLTPEDALAMRARQLGLAGGAGNASFSDNRVKPSSKSVTVSKTTSVASPAVRSLAFAGTHAGSFSVSNPKDKAVLSAVSQVAAEAAAANAHEAQESAKRHSVRGPTPLTPPPPSLRGPQFAQCAAFL